MKLSRTRTRALILVADDSITQARRSAQALEAAGFRVQLAENGREALERARRWRPDVIVSDILMPVMDGFALCREARRDPLLADVPIVLHTITFVDTKDEAFARAIGATRFLTKPSDPEDLVREVRGVLATGHVADTPAIAFDEGAFLEGYSERLVAKLEEKIANLESTNQQLERQNQQMVAAHDRLALLLEISQLAASSLDIDVLLDRLVGRLVTALHVTFCRISLVDESEQRLIIRAARAIRVSDWEPGVGHAIPLPEAPVHRAVMAIGESRVVRLDGAPEEMTGAERTAAGLDGVKTAMLVPMLASNQPIGVLCLAEVRSWERRPLASEQAELAQAMAAQAVVAIQNARLYDEVRRRSTELEQLVAVYMAELAARHRAEETLREQEQRLGELVARLLNAQEDERRRIAYDIHDGPAQMLVGAYQYLQTADRLLVENPEKAQLYQQRGLTILGSTMQEVRQVIGQLRPTLLDDFGLGAAVKRLIDDAKAGTGWDVAFTDELGEQRLRPEVEVAAYRIVQEALTNARKYAEARRVAVRASLAADRLLLEVRDWGRGFDRKQVSANVGLESMVERAALLGGKCEIESQPGEGTRVFAWLPLTMLK